MKENRLKLVNLLQFSLSYSLVASNDLLPSSLRGLVFEDDFILAPLYSAKQKDQTMSNTASECQPLVVLIFVFGFV